VSFPRYEEYKNSGISWLGNVPAHWEIFPLKAVASGDDTAFIDGDWIESRHLSETGVRYITTGNVGLGIYKEQGTGYISNDTFAQLGCTAVRPGDLLISRLNAPIGRACIAPALGVTVVTSVDNVIVRPSNTFDRKFLVFRLSSSDYFHEAGNIASGATMQRISRSELGNIRIAFPPLNEQISIAVFLGRETAKIDALIAEQEKLIALLAEKRQATISHAVTKGLNPNAPMKDSGVAWLGEVPEHWDVRPLKFLAKIGNGSTPNRDNPDYWADEGFPWLNSSVVNQEEVTEAERFVTEKALSECHLPIINPPAILVGITGQGKTRGMATQLQFTATVNQHLAYVKPDVKQLTPTFLLRCLESAYDHLRTESDGAGSTKGAITCDQLGRLRMPAPRVNEQEKIVSFLEMEVTKLDNLEADAIRAITLLKERRSALITVAVTGQIDVRNLTPEIPA